jgi:SAM-dependent methyltransferase
MESENPPTGAVTGGAVTDRGPHYRTWIRGTRLVRLAILSGICLVGSALSPLSPWFLLFLVPFALFGYTTLILVLTHYRLAPRGGDLQRHIHELIVAKADLAAPSRLAANERVLYIGCGAGSLAIKLAKSAADRTVTGVDSWGGDWEYSKQQCDDNARSEGVSARTVFRQDSGAALGFADGSFAIWSR